MFGLAIHLLHKVVKDVIAQAQRMFPSVTVAPSFPAEQKLRTESLSRTVVLEGDTLFMDVFRRTRKLRVQLQPLALPSGAGTLATTEFLYMPFLQLGIRLLFLDLPWRAGDASAGDSADLYLCSVPLDVSRDYRDLWHV